MIAIATILRRLAAACTRAADRLDPPQEGYTAFLARLQAEARGNVDVFERGLSEALDRVYRDRPTTYSRKLRAINGGRR